MDRADELQTICEEVEAKWEMVGLSSDGGLYSDYAKEVARRFAALVRAQVLLEVQQPVHVHSTSGDLGGSYDATALQAEIMNLPPEVDMCESGDFRAGYRAGHRDARYAAAELVASTGADTGRHGSDEHESGASAAVHRVKEQ